MNSKYLTSQEQCERTPHHIGLQTSPQQLQFSINHYVRSKIIITLFNQTNKQ